MLIIVFVVALVLIVVSRCGFILFAVTQSTLFSPGSVTVLPDSLQFESYVDLYGK